jgi:hypothetical protein
MEWMNRGGNTPQQASQQSAHSSTTGAPTAHRPSTTSTKVNGSKDGDKHPSKVVRIASVFLLFAATALAVSVLAYLAFVKPQNTNAAKHVDTSKFQAVFLNGGQVYFGRVTALNSNYMKLNEIYYLRVNQQVQPNGTQTQGDVQLVKLGCELHGPQDEMVIYKDQIVFWENLKDDGQVAQAIKKYVEENPNGQQCQTNQQQSNTNNSNSNSQTQNNTNANTNNTNTNTNR